MALSVGVKGNRRRPVEVSKRAIFYLILIGYTVLTSVPFIWSILTSFKTQAETSLPTPTGLPVHPTLDAWKTVLGLVPNQGITIDFPTYFKNSLIVASLVMIGNLFFDSLAGYAFARMKFPGRQLLFYLIIGTLMIPAAMTIIPVFVILAKVPGVLGGPWIGTYEGLTVPFMVSAFGIFLMRQFFMSLPLELEEAGRIDGLSRFGMFWRIALPLSRPALATLAILQFQGNWDSFLMPSFITLGTPSVYTLPVGLQQFAFAYTTLWPDVMAGAMVVILPILAVYIFAQRYFLEGFSRSGLKG